MNSNWITELEINNFKSIKHIKMDCKRINVLIGKPNVGKSNILEALSFFEIPSEDPSKKMLGDYVRYEKINQLFYFLERKNPISIVTNLGFAMFWHENDTYRIAISPDNNVLTKLKTEGVNHISSDPHRFFEPFQNKDRKGPIPFYHAFIIDSQRKNVMHYDGSGFFNPIKKYHFKHLTEHKNHFQDYLLPPFGDNLFTIIESNRELWHEYAGLFNSYGFDLLLDLEEEKLFVQRKEGRYVTKIPYSLVADTLLRYIFHLAAIGTNTNSILLFEEPESHSFPPYIIHLAEKIIENKSNQFFIATHSPDLLMPFLEQGSWDEVAVFIADFENYETTVRALNKEEMQSILDDGIDIFFNLRAFQ